MEKAIIKTRKNKVKNTKTINCAECSKEFSFSLNKKTSKRRFCSLLCACSNNGKMNKGRKHTEEHKKLISEMMTGEKNHFFGKKHNQEVKDAISKSNTGRNSGEKSPHYMDLKERIKLNIHVNNENGCWEWISWMRSRGNAGKYGGLKHMGKSMFAHRASYEAFNGDIPEGYQVCHKCDNTICVNPDHLFIGSQSDNMRDMAIKDRGTSKLSIDDVLHIRALSKTNLQKEIAKMYNVSTATISNIIKGKSRQHV